MSHLLPQLGRWLSSGGRGLGRRAPGLIPRRAGAVQGSGPWYSRRHRVFELSPLRSSYLMALSLAAAACSSEPSVSIDGAANLDAGFLATDGASTDASALSDVGTLSDAQVGTDTPIPGDGGGFDDAQAADAQGTDAGPMTMPELVPGSHVRVTEGRIDIMRHTFADVTSILGPGTRSQAANTRSYEWTLSGGVELTVWFANSNLDDDAPPADVDATDTVLWIAVQGGFAGTTPEGIGLGSVRGQVEAAGAYGAPPHTVNVPNPAGTLAQYYVRGLLVAYDPAGSVRTITICRAYPQAPDGSIDPNDSRLRFGRDLQAYTFVAGIPVSHDSLSDARSLLGAPDAEGNVVVSGQNLHLLSYAFIGIEVFALASASEIAFVTIHAPYYGTAGGVGIGSTRTSMESFLAGQSYNGGSVSASSPNFICYGHNSNGPDVGVTYSTDVAPLVTSMVIPLHQCP